MDLRKGNVGMQLTAANGSSRLCPSQAGFMPAGSPPKYIPHPAIAHVGIRHECPGNVSRDKAAGSLHTLRSCHKTMIEALSPSPCVGETAIAYGWTVANPARNSFVKGQ